MRTTMRFFLSAIAIVLSSSGGAAELHLYLGGLKSPRHSDPTYSWALEYRRPIGDHWSGGFTWLNEGHIPRHHRDGQAAQLWWHTSAVGSGPGFAIGLGPYHYFDTVVAANPDGYTDVHGWGWIASAGATWPLDERWLASIRLNRIRAGDSTRSTAVVAGLGYRFGYTGNAPSRTGRLSPPADFHRWELAVMTGATVINSFDSDMDIAAAISWRMRMSDHLTGSVTYLDEGRLRPGRRSGFAPQIWLEDGLTERISVALGVGPYFAVRKPPRTGGLRTPTMSTLTSITASYTFTPEWVARMVWNRVGTRYDRDTDVVMFGLGRRF